MKTILIGLAALIMIGCASVKRMRGTEAIPTSQENVQNLKITVEAVPELSLEGYHLASVYFRNLNDNWLRIKSIDVVNVDGSPGYQVVLGNDLRAWRKSVALDFDLQLEDEKDETKKQNLVVMKRKLEFYSDEDHLYKPFGMPSQLQTQKWILFQIPKNEIINGFKFKVRFIDATTQIYEVKVKP